MVFVLNKMVEKNESLAGYKFKDKKLELVEQIACANGLGDFLAKAIGGGLKR